MDVEDQLMDVSYTLHCFQNEGAYAISLAVEEILGRMDMGTSGASDRPPQMINVYLPNKETIKVPWGKIMLPGFDDKCYISMGYDSFDVEINIDARIRIIDRARQILAEKALYKGQAINLEIDSDGEVNEPTFMDLSAINESKILFSKEINDGLVPILSRIKSPKTCIDLGLDLKLGVLMEGPYGTGKTLTAFWLGKIATEFGWTFIYLKNCRDSAKALRVAENYARNNNGVILFTEDIDQIIRGKRGQEIQDIVNTLDGGDNKNLPIISIFTTNHIEVIEPTFLRGKRIGSLIPFGVLDMDTAKQFIDKLVVDKKGNTLMEKGDHSPAYQALCGIVPAFASEVIDKAKAYMIHRGATKINANDIVIAATSYKKQIEYAECRKIEKNDSIRDALNTIGKQLFSGDENTDSEMLEKLANVYHTIQNRSSK
jgi:transitional endoplasmic reticulum ATPase